MIVFGGLCLCVHEYEYTHVQIDCQQLLFDNPRYTQTAMISKIYKQNTNIYPARPIGEVMPRHVFRERFLRRPILQKIGNVWELYCDYEARAIPKSHGFCWSPTQKVWFTDNPKKAITLIQYATDSTKAHLLELFACNPE